MLTKGPVNAAIERHHKIYRHFFTEFNVEVPGDYVLVDHALTRVDRGAWGILNVSGKADSTIYTSRGYGCGFYNHLILAESKALKQAHSQSM